MSLQNHDILHEITDKERERERERERIEELNKDKS
jgi:hypothetical protein